MSSDTAKEVVTKLRSVFEEADLRRIISEAVKASKFSVFLKGMGNKRMLESAVAQSQRSSRSTIKNLPLSIRPIAVSVLANFVQRLPILEVPLPFLSFSLHQFFTTNHAPLLKECLAFFGIPSDDHGNAKASPDISKDLRSSVALKSLASGLASSYGSTVVRQYFVAASIVDRRLHFLIEAAKLLDEPSLREVATERDEPTISPATDRPDDYEKKSLPTQTSAPTPPSATSNDPLIERVRGLSRELKDASLIIEDGQVPDPERIVALWQSVFSEIQEMRGSVGCPESATIFEIKAMLESRERNREIEVLERASSLWSVDLSSNDAVRPIAEAATVLKADIRNGLAVGDYRSQVQLFERLVVFIENNREGGSAHDLREMVELQSALAQAFDPVSAIAVVAGRIRLRVVDPDLTRTTKIEAIPDERSFPLLLNEEQGGPINASVQTIQSNEDVSIDGFGPAQVTEPRPHETSNLFHTDSNALTSSTASNNENPKNPVDQYGKQDATRTDQETEQGAEPATASLDHCIPYGVFRANHWIDSEGLVQLAPWVDQNAFTAVLNSAAIASASERSLTTAYLMQRAVEALGGTPFLGSNLISEVADFMNGETEAGPERSRLARFDGGENGPLHPDAKKLSLVLEALAPGSDLWSHSSLLSAAVRNAQFNNATIARLTTALLSDAIENAGVRKLARRTIAAALRSGRSSEDTVPQYMADVKEAFEGLTQTSRRLRTEHCREAWRSFLRSSADASVRALIKTKASSLEGKTIRAIEQDIREQSLISFDNSGAKYEDRTRMDRAVQDLMQKLSNLRHTVEDIRVQDNGLEALERFDFPSIDELKGLATEEINDPIESLCRSLFFSLAPTAQRNAPMLLTANDLIQRPALALHLGFSGPVSIQDFEFDARNVASPIQAAAVLLTEPFEIADHADRAQTIKEHIFAMRRLDVMSMYLAEQSLNSAERSRLQRQLRAEGVDRADDAYRRLNDAWFECEAIGTPMANPVLGFMEEARSLLDKAEDATFSDTALLTAWLEHLRAICKQQTELSAAAIRASVAEKNPELLRFVDDAISESRFWELPFALDGIVHPHQSGHIMPAARWTPWREKAEVLPSHIQERLAAVAIDSKSEFGRLVDEWFNGSDSDEGRRSVRRLFFDFVSGDMSPVARPQRRTRKDAPFDREIKSKRIIIDCRSVLSMLESQGTNPSFVPQLHNFSSIIILSAPNSAIVRSSDAAVWARYVHSEVHGEAGVNTNSNAVAVLLAPRISRPMREQVMDEFQRRQNAFVGIVIDDLDILRMTGERGAPPADIRQFLEIVLEQFPLNNSKSTPYSSQDGQHIRREMYVGRVGDAESLALSAKYTRVFSGRKLGKSAFLKSVADKYDGRILTSGNKLSVLFVSIAGGDSESYISDRIRRELVERFPLSASTIPLASSASDGLLQTIEHVIRQQSKVSILLLLDEADAFVEEQLRQYDRNREKCLSFRLMKEVAQHLDAAGLPRVRVIFSGYRVTNTRGGAWANAGEVLILPPLAAEEAHNLIEAPLARLGIDAQSQAAFIARRCGNQPAIINKLGDTLIKHLKDSSPVTRKDVLRVVNSHVVTAFNDPSIADEIRTVIFNNFQGNPLGQIVFAAMLLAFSKLAPGFELPDAENAILEQIRVVDANVDWLERRDPSLTGEIERQLNDFQDRKLVRRNEMHGQVSYRLQVSHSLPVLLAGDLPGQIRRAVHTLRGVHGYDIQPVRGVLSEAQFEAIRIGQTKSEQCSLVVVTGNWPTALNDPRVGVPDRMGISPSDVAVGNRDARRAKAHINITAATLETFLGSPSPAVVVVTGGTDVARRLLQLSRAAFETRIIWQSLARVPALGVKWWFEHLRSLNFMFPEAADEIVALTGCIPILLEKFDSILMNRFAEEADVSRSEFGLATKDFASALAAIGQELTRGIDECRLEKREIEVLKMLCVMAKALGKVSLEDEFTEEYWTLASDGLFLDGRPPRPSDAAAIELLIRIGLVKVEGGLMIYDAAAPDPIFMIAELL